MPDRDDFYQQAARDLDWFRQFRAKDLPMTSQDWLDWAWQQA